MVDCWVAVRLVLAAPELGQELTPLAAYTSWCSLFNPLHQDLEVFSLDFFALHGLVLQLLMSGIKLFFC